MTDYLFDSPTGQPAESEPLQRRAAKPPVTRPPLTDALKAILVAGGYMDAETGAFRNARITRCPDCRRQVWRGLNADTMAWAVDAESGPLTAWGEAMARLGGWTTVTLRATPISFLLDVRGPAHISGEPAGSRHQCDVLLIHRCGIKSDAIERGPSRIEYRTAEQKLPPDAPAPF